MNHLALGTTTALLAIAISATASGDDVSPETKIARAEAEVELAKQAIDLAEDCSAQIEVQIDWTHFPDDAFDYSVADYCESLIDAVGYHCEAGAAKKTWIAEHVDTLVCAYEPNDAATTRIEANAKRVTGHLNFNTSNLEDRFRAALLRSL